MGNIKLEHVSRLVQIESTIQYDSPPPAGTAPFCVVAIPDSPVLLSAPHGAGTWRDNGRETWHEEDEYTAGIALLLSELCQTSAIAATWRSDGYDPNWHRDCTYKDALADLISKQQIRYVIDLHGAALNSRFLDMDQTVDLGFRSEMDAERSMDERHVSRLECLLQAAGEGCDRACCVVKRNRFSAKQAGTVTSFVHKRFGRKTTYKVQSIQVELKPQLRVVNRLPAATLFREKGPYQANPACIVHLLQALADFVDYLRAVE